MPEGLETLRRQRGTCKARLTHFETFITGFSESGEPVEALKAKIKFVQNSWSQFDRVQSQIETLDGDDAERPVIEDRYCLLLGRARALVNTLTRPAGANREHADVGNANNGIKVKLPAINLPVFDGNPEKWLEFRDSFQGLIDGNCELTNIQRMYYLRSSLKDRAAEVIQSLESSAENYPIAWNLLTKRFEDKRAIASRHLQLLLDVSVMQKESGNQLRQTLDGILRHIRALESLRANTWDTIINHLMIAKFDSATRRKWRSHIKDKEDITVASLTEFLEERCSIIEPETSRSVSGKPQRNKSMSQQRKVDGSTAFASTSKENRSMRKCTFCDEESHMMYACNKFKDLTVLQRISAVNERKLCRNCLRPNHFAQDCQSSACKNCNAKHNTLLHPSNHAEKVVNSEIANASSVSVGNARQQDSSVNCNSVSFPVQSRVLLSTARVWITMLLYNCSVGALASSINLTECASTVIQSRHTAYRAKVQFLIVKQIIEQLPLSKIAVDQLRIPPNIKLADERFYIPDRVDAILGASVFWELLCIGQIKLGKSLPILQKTHLGWVVSRDVALGDPPRFYICCFSSEATLHNQIEKFWKIEEVEHKAVMSSDDEICERHFMKTHWQDDTGRFTVSLPFKGNPSELGESRSYALKLFYKLKRRLEKNAKLREDYVKFMNECIEFNHMSVINSEQEEPVAVYYIPHHPVVTHEGGKLRVVFNASAKTSSGKSLNDILRVGPNIQQTLFAIALRFQQHLYVITADIVKMYCQVNLQEDQRHLQRILWKPSIDGPILDHLLLMIIYGNAASAFQAIRSLHQAAHNARKSYPAASQIIIRDFYVDDLLTGCNDLDELRALKDELISDESLPINLHTEWTTYVQELSSINDISIPRVIICKDPVHIELHGFSDASESAYGACIYLRSVDATGNVTIRLVCAKSKVAPLKTLCIARLELLAALLLSKLAYSTTQALTITLPDRFYWCDSEIVLAWIHGEPHIRKAFVANRLTEIHQLTSQEQWRHVRSEDNPADVISRGIRPSQLKDLRLWWHGPQWLQHPEDQINLPTPKPNGEVPETKKSTVLATQVIETNDILKKFSSLSKLKRVIAYCLRWKERPKPSQTQQMRPFSAWYKRSVLVEKFSNYRLSRESGTIVHSLRCTHSWIATTLFELVDACVTPRKALLTYEEMYTVCTQVEAVLNSRPLTPISNDPTDLTALTPGHFLIGEALTSIPEPNWSEVPSNRLTRFQYVAKLTQHFWSRWSNEYLSNLQQRCKWNREDQASKIEIGAMVVLRDEQASPMRWALGRIVECHSGHDGITQVVSVKTSKGVTKRALSKICLLPIEV
ncbi:uncharacterized protein LOC112457783 [Temnothorax curvispinosus]|uniref:Uncharacterized protein LOC112457783 n=1 Tax=Temnothorax curvispinosus TaxID=300111 RepID=A0A6J1Q3N9_9HYME|nr:uncharacterized protein LOC112457783 [Temnothorax curvispinosus]